MGVCTSKHVTALSVQPTGTASLARPTETCLVVNSKRHKVPTLGPIVASPLAARRAKLMQRLVREAPSPSRVEDTQSPALQSSKEE